jgi:ABC-type molybdate transport system permease subunit
MPIEIFESYRAGDDARALGYVLMLTAVSVVVVTVAARMSPREPS